MPADAPMVSFAQNFEDVVLARVLAEVHRGFYIDVGAHHPEQDSVTKHFSDRGWSGINLEPGRHYPDLVRERPHDINVPAAVTNRCGTITFYESDSPGLDSVEEQPPDSVRWALGERKPRTVEAVTLAEIFRRHVAGRTVDFLKVDVEGHEREVIEGNDWQVNRPRVVLVEATEPGTRTASHDTWEPLLLAANYRFVYFDGLNRFYLRREDDSLNDRFGPPCIFDRFITAETARLQAGDPVVTGTIRELTAERDYLTRELQSLREGLQDRDRLLSGIGPRSLRASLWMARSLSRLKRQLTRRAA